MNLYGQKHAKYILAVHVKLFHQTVGGMNLPRGISIHQQSRRKRKKDKKEKKEKEEKKKDLQMFHGEGNSLTYGEKHKLST